jgi:hypothetical protein
MITVLTLALALSQDPAALPKPDEGWKPFINAELIVNEEIITTEDVLRAVARSQTKVNSDADRRQLQSQIIQSKVRDLLEEQAGKVIGYDEKLVERFVSDNLEEQREQAGGTIALSTELKERNVDSFEHKDETRTGVYRILWERSTIGLYAGPSGRPSRDRYVRPGRLFFESRDQAASLAADPIVTLHELSLGNKSVTQADLEKIHAALAAARDRILAGEEFDVIAKQVNSDFEKSGRMPPMRSSAIGSMVADGVDFARTAAVGDVSEVLEFRIGGKLVGYSVLKLVDRETSVKFADHVMQDDLTKRTQTYLDNYRIGVGLSNLLDAAYVWPPESFNREASMPKQP